MNFNLIFLIFSLISVNDQMLVSGDVESALVFTNKKSLKEDENLSSMTGLQLNSESNQQNLVPTVINLPKDTDQTNSESKNNETNINQKKTAKKKGKKKGGKTLEHKIKGRVIDNDPSSQPNPEQHEDNEDDEADYELDDEPEIDDVETHQKFENLTNQNSTENSPIIHSPPNNTPNKDKQVNSFTFVAGQKKPIVEAHSTEPQSSPTPLNTDNYSNLSNQLTRPNILGYSYFPTYYYTLSDNEVPFKVSGYSYFPVILTPANHGQLYNTSMDYSQENYNSTDYESTNYNQSSYNASNEYADYNISISYDQGNYNFTDYGSTLYNASNEYGDYNSTDYTPINYNQSTYNIPNEYSDYNTSTNYDQEIYNSTLSYNNETANYDKEIYNTSTYSSTNVDVSGYNYTESPYDYLEEAKKIANKIGYQNDKHGFYPSVYINPYNRYYNIYPSVYSMINHNKYTKVQAAVSNPAVVAKPESPYFSYPIITTFGKVVNQPPKIITITKPYSYASVDLFRRACTLKINGFAAFGTCRTSCNSHEIGIKTKLKESCSSYQLACNNAFELCCIPNRSIDNGQCNLDLFNPNEIITRIETLFNLPPNSLINLSRLPPGTLDSLINKRPIYMPFYSSSNYKSEAYDVSRPSILHGKNIKPISYPILHGKNIKTISNPYESRSLNEDAKSQLFDLAKIISEFKTSFSQSIFEKNDIDDIKAKELKLLKKG